MTEPVKKTERPEGAQPATVAAFREYMAQHRTETASGETNLQFPEWMKQAYPQQYPLWLKASGQGK